MLPDNQHALTQPLARIVTRYGNAALGALSVGTAAVGAPILDDPDIQIFLTLAVNAFIAWLTERAWLQARATGGPT